MTSQSEYASLNRWVLSLDLNVVMESDLCVGGESSIVWVPRIRGAWL